MGMRRCAPGNGLLDKHTFMNKNKLVLPLAAFTLAVSAAGGAVAMASADTIAATPATTQSATTQAARVKPAAIGKVTAISGTTITLADEHSSTTYTVDAASATVLKHEAPAAGTMPAPGTKPAETTISVSDIVVGDMLMVEGTANGTSVIATTIHDGIGFGGGHGGRGPGIQGTVTAVNGSSLTVTGQDGKTYTVDGTSAEATKMQTISVSDITVGDTIGVDGTVSGTSVTATHIMDGMRKPAATTATTSS